MLLRRCEPLLVFSIATAAYVVWRWSPYFVWDDTSSASYNMFSNAGHYSLDRIWAIVVEVFPNIQGDGYRPISAFIRGFGNGYVFSLGIHPVPFILVNGVLCGLTAILYLEFAGYFVGTAGARYFAGFLFFASTPVLTGGLVLFSGVHFLVLLLLLLIPTAYLHYDQDKRRVWLWLAGTGLLVGPWVREIVGIAAGVILVHEALNRRGIRTIGILAFLGLLHALFPTFILSLVFSTLPVKSIFAMGNLAAFAQAPVAGGRWFGKLAGLHWRIFGDVFSILPPSLVLAGLIVFCWSSSVYAKTSVDRLRKQLLLLIFFAAAFLPFLKVFNEQVHLSYSLIPLTILLAMQIEFLFGYFDERQSVAAMWALWVFLGVVVVDHGINVIAVRGATRAIYETIDGLAERFTLTVPPNTVIISNAHHLEDIRFYARGYIDPWAGVGGIPDRRRWLFSSDDLQRLLDRRRDRDVYFLDVRLPERKGQRGAERVLTMVRDQVVSMRSEGRIAATSYRYPYFDPARLLLPRTVATWPGPPDLEFDFYRGRALSGTPFLREVTVDYFLYKVTGTRIRRWAAHPVLLVKNLCGYNVVGFRDVVYAIPRSEGAFDLARFVNGSYSRSFHGPDVDTVTAAVRASVGAGGASSLQVAR